MNRAPESETAAVSLAAQAQIRALLAQVAVLQAKIRELQAQSALPTTTQSAGNPIAPLPFTQTAGKASSRILFDFDNPMRYTSDIAGLELDTEADAGEGEE